MGLESTDAKPDGISFSTAYEAIRTWHSSNISKVEARNDDYSKRSVALIKALPQLSGSTLETRAILGEVVYGNLEWAYHESDGRFKMAAYAHAAFEAAGLSFHLSDAEIQEVSRSSAISKHLSFNQR